MVLCIEERIIPTLNRVLGTDMFGKQHSLLYGRKAG